MIKILESLKTSGVLGMNRRVGEFILPYNKRKFYPLVDNKIETHLLSEKLGVPNPRNYFFIKNYGEVMKLKDKIKGLNSFVIKPNRGSQGNGILIINEIKEEENIFTFKTSRGTLSLKDIKRHVLDILSGMYALNNLPDEVIFQEKLKIHEMLSPYTYKGIPDIRMIVFQGYPVMSMIRLPTKESRGKANLHQGAVGCGLKISDGVVTHAIHKNLLIKNHPDTGKEFFNLKIPYWREILTLSSKCYDFTKMGYLGVDIVLDPNLGPLLLEINARPGLSIQIANMTGLLPMLQIIKEQNDKASSEEKVAFSLRHF